MPKSRVVLPDVLLIAGTLLLALLALFPRAVYREAAYFSVLSESGEQILPLSEDARLSIVSNGIALTIVCENGRVAVIDSDCGDGICVQTGEISLAGETIVCLPAKVAVSVIGTEKERTDEDFIVG